MKLSEQEETALVKKYEGLMHSMVYRFEFKMNRDHDLHDDLYQECCVALIEWMRKAKDMEEFTRNPPVKQMTHAMCLFILSTQALSYPKRTSDFREKINSAQRSVPLSDRNEFQESEDREYRAIRRADDRMAVSSFVNSLPDESKKLVKDRLDGVPRISSAERLGKSPSFITRKCRDIGNAYLDSVS